MRREEEEEPTLLCFLLAYASLVCRSALLLLPSIWFHAANWTPVIVVDDSSSNNKCLSAKGQIIFWLLLLLFDQNFSCRIFFFILKNFRIFTVFQNCQKKFHLQNSTYVCLQKWTRWCCQISLESIREQKNIDLNARDINGGTSFMFACQNGHKDVVKLENKLVELRLFLGNFWHCAILVFWPFNSLTPHQKEIRKVKIFCCCWALLLAKKLIQNAAQLADISWSAEVDWPLGHTLLLMWRRRTRNTQHIIEEEGEEETYLPKSTIALSSENEWALSTGLGPGPYFRWWMSPSS